MVVNQFASELLRRAADELEADTVGVQVRCATVGIFLSVGEKYWNYAVSYLEIEHILTRQYYLMTY